MHPTIKSAIWLGVLVLVVMIAQFLYHNYRTTPRDARAITERELRLGVLEPGERPVHIVSVLRRSPLDYYRATRGLLVLTDRRLVYLGLMPRDLVASPDAPAAFEQREFPLDTLHEVRKGRAIFFTVPGLVIRTPGPDVRLAVPADQRDEAETLRKALETRYAAARADAQRQLSERARVEASRKQAEAAARQAIYHDVQRGEALASIARKYQTTPEYLQQINNLPNANIRVGQRLLIKPSF